MSGRETSAKWMVLIWFGITAAIIFMPLNRPRTGVGVGSAIAAPLTGTFTQHCVGELVSKVDGLSKCVAPSPCPTVPPGGELDSLDTVGVTTFGAGGSVSGNAESVEVSHNNSGSSGVSNDAMYHNPFGIILSGTVTYGTGSPIPTNCFTINQSGFVSAGAVKVCFKAASEGCSFSGGMGYASDSTLTSLAITANCATGTYTPSPTNLQCVAEK